MRRVDCLFVIIGISVFSFFAWASLWAAGEHRRIFVCAHHEKQLGDAFSAFANDHNGALSPAVFDDGKNRTSWDWEIAPYLMDGGSRNSASSQRPSSGLPPPSPRSAGDGNRSGEQFKKVAYLFHCPSDTELRGGALPRSYSMPMYDVNKAGWPPDEDAAGGLGLFLDTKALEKAHALEGGVPANSDTRQDGSIKIEVNGIPAIKVSGISAPADTALLVERISILNALWQPKYACIIAPREQWDAKTIQRKKFHGGKMNYLMLDGHVELLWPAQSAGHTGSGNAGLWTIRPGD